MRIFIALLSVLYLPISWASCSLPFEPHQKGYNQPQEMVNQLTAAGWTVTGLSEIQTDPNFPTIQWTNVNAYNPAFTYTYAGVTKSMCDVAEKWDIIPQAEKEAFYFALGSLIEFNPNQYSSVKSVTRDFNSGGLRGQNYQSYNEFHGWFPPSPLYNDWYDDSFDFGYTTKAQHSNNGTLADATQTVIWIDDDVQKYYSQSVFGYGSSLLILNPPKHHIGESNPFEIILWQPNHASIIAALGLQIEGFKIDNRYVEYGPGTGWIGFYQLLSELNNIAESNNNLQVVAMPNGVDNPTADLGLEGLKSAIAITKNKVMVSAAMNETYAGTDCQIGNYWVFGYDTPIGYHDGRCITRDDYNARWSTPATGFDLYQQIDYGTMQVLTGKAPVTPNYNDNTSTLTVGWMANELTPARLGSGRGTKTDILCEFDGFYYQSSSMCTATTAALAAVIVKEHPDWTAQCVIDSFINPTKLRNGKMTKTGDGTGYGVYKADNVIEYATTHANKCDTALGIVATPNLYYGLNRTHTTINGVTVTDWTTGGTAKVRSAKHGKALAEACTLLGGAINQLYVTDNTTNPPTYTNIGISGITAQNAGNVTMNCHSGSFNTNSLVTYTNAYPISSAESSGYAISATPN